MLLIRNLICYNNYILNTFSLRKIELNKVKGKIVNKKNVKNSYIIFQ